MSESPVSSSISADVLSSGLAPELEVPERSFISTELFASNKRQSPTMSSGVYSWNLNGSEFALLCMSGLKIGERTEKATLLISADGGIELDTVGWEFTEGRGWNSMAFMKFSISNKSLLIRGLFDFIRSSKSDPSAWNDLTGVGIAGDWDQFQFSYSKMGDITDVAGRHISVGGIDCVTTWGLPECPNMFDVKRDVCGWVAWVCETLCVRFPEIPGCCGSTKLFELLDLRGAGLKFTKKKKKSEVISRDSHERT